MNIGKLLPVFEADTVEEKENSDVLLSKKELENNTIKEERETVIDVNKRLWHYMDYCG